MILKLYDALGADFLVNTDHIVSTTAASAASAYRGTNSIIRTSDGQRLESAQTVEKITRTIQKGN